MFREDTSPIPSRPMRLGAQVSGASERTLPPGPPRRKSQPPINIGTFKPPFQGRRSVGTLFLEGNLSSREQDKPALKMHPRQALAECIRHSNQPLSLPRPKKIKQVGRKKNTCPGLYRNACFPEPPFELTTIYNEVLFVGLLIPKPLQSHQEVKNKSECTGVVFNSQKAPMGCKGAHRVLDHNVGIFQVVKNPRKDGDINEASLHRNILRIRNEIVDVAGICTSIALFQGDANHAFRQIETENGLKGIPQRERYSTRSTPYFEHDVAS